MAVATQEKSEAKAGSVPATGGLRALLGKKTILIAAAGACVLMIGAGAFFLTRGHREAQPADTLEVALAALDEGQFDVAEELARKLEKAGQTDAEFPGGVAYILGMTAFRTARGQDEQAGEAQFVAVAAFLREAEQLTMPDERRPAWAFAMGICLHRTGQSDEALPLLEEAFKGFAAGRVEAGLLLTQLYMDGRTRRNMERALELNTQMLEDAGLTHSQRDEASLLRSQMLVALDRRAEAEQALRGVSRETVRQQGRLLLDSQVAIADGRYREALQTLEPVSRDAGLDRGLAPRVLYLLGLCTEQLGEYDNAVNFYERTIRRGEGTQEAHAAWLGAATSLRKLGRNEESLENYAAILRSIRRPKSFRNRWLSLKKLQETVFEAWNTWTEQHFYNEAIALAELMSPAVPREQALELVARAEHRWAQHVEAEVAALPYDRQGSRRAEVQLRWRRSGEAYGRLAENRKSSADYFAALWTSSEHFFQGHDFESAIRQLDTFIESRPARLLPAALVLRGQCRMNLAQSDDALRDFQEAIVISPTDQAAFQAKYLIGACHLERNEPELAEKAWRKILESPDLTPTAIEWRKALYSFGKLLYDTAELRRRSGTPTEPGAAPSSDHLSAAGLRFDEAILRLEEFRDRYPSAPETPEVRYLLGRSLQKSAEYPEARWKTAETDNARAEFRRQMQERLDRAIREFQQLQSQLLAQQSNGRLDQKGQALLRSCFFEIANCLFSLGRYEEAIAAFSTSAGRYQQETDALTAYVQIANCYDRLQKPAEATSTLVQANLILKQLPDSAFRTGASSMSRDGWQKWLDWAMKLHQ